eukprot:TRINITY_DN11833_c0_g1_i2.p1 TRINITY_DN11833_c0_g1~~TRINITY_DN11833_c0_g1_i2.p1  ORF type:complete len:301 (+),score=77.19 TRINITY_DN11833_c0_g1_i2:43-945(+)
MPAPTAADVTAIFDGAAAECDEELATCEIVDDDKDVTVFAVEADHTAVYVTYSQSGFKERAGIARAVCYNVDTKQLEVVLHGAGRTQQRKWKLSLRDVADMRAVLVAIRRVCKATVAYTVREEAVMRRTGLADVCEQYAHLVGGSVMGGGQDGGVEAVGEAMREDAHAMESSLMTLQQTHDHLKEEALPALVAVAQQLEAFYAQLDAMEPLLDDVAAHTAQLDKCVTQYTAPPQDLKERAKQLFSWGSKSKPAASQKQGPLIPRDYTIGGAPPAEFLAHLHNSLASFSPAEPSVPQEVVL